jgi:hypothetical protein
MTRISSMRNFATDSKVHQLLNARTDELPITLEEPVASFGKAQVGDLAFWRWPTSLP